MRIAPGTRLGTEQRRRITYSRSFVLSLSRPDRPHPYPPQEVDELLGGAVRRNAKELLVLIGDAPLDDPQLRARLVGYGHADLLSYVF